MKLLKNENQNYDAWLHWDVTKRCNLDCDYCFGKITDAKVKVNSINIDKLIASLDKNEKIFRISFTGGEPTLVPNFVEACKSITEKHLISFNSNLIMSNIVKFANEINHERVLHIHASFHFDELFSKNLFEKFVNNYHLLKNKGFNIYAEAVAYPKIVNSVENIIQFANENSINLTFAPFYGNYEGKTYPESYSQSEIELFGISQSQIACFAQKGNICNAGFNAAVVFSNGNIYPCHQIKTKIGNIYEGFSFADKLIECPSKKCGCPLNEYDEYLFGHAKYKNRVNFSDDFMIERNQPPLQTRREIFE